MAIFNYTLASGDRFTLRAPTGTTQGQADAVFYSQVAAGSLVGYLPGQTLSSGLSQITKFQLSRLDRGTAGVDDIALLSVVAGLPVISAALPSSINTALTNPVNVANVVGIVSDGTGYNNGSNLNAPEIGPLSSSQVQAVQAQIINFVNQPANTITVPGVAGNIVTASNTVSTSGYGIVLNINGTALTISPGTRGINTAVDTLNFYETIGSNPYTTAQVSPGGINGTATITLTDTLSFYSGSSLVTTATVTSGGITGNTAVITATNSAIVVGQTVTDSLMLILPGTTVSSVSGTTITFSSSSLTNSNIQVGQYITDSLGLIPPFTNTANAVSSSAGAGVGQYGLTAQQLEQAGYLKPGTSEFITDGNESITGPTSFSVSSPVQYYTVTGIPGTTFTWQSIGGWYKAPTDPTWCAFMDQYAVWTGDPQAITTNFYSFNLTFPVTGNYILNLSTDNYGSVNINGVGTFDWGDFHTVGSITQLITAGTYLVILTITNSGGPAGIAAQILKPDSTELWNTLSIISDSPNPNGFTRGGPYTFNDIGTFDPIPASYDMAGTYQYTGIFSTGHTFPWTNTILFNGPVGANYTIRTPGNFVQVLSSPGIWTGKDGINSLNSLLTSPLIQNIAQTTLMQNAYNQLTATGVITPPVSRPSISQGQIYTQSGLQQVSAISLAVNSALSVPGPVQSALSNFPAVALTSAAVAITSSLVNGAVNNINSGADSTVSDNTTRQVNSIVTGTTASLISTASKFGTIAVDSYVTSKLGNNVASQVVNSYINKTINQVTNSVTKTINSTITNVISGKTNINDAIDNLGKSSNFASLASDPGAAIDNLTTNITDNISVAADKVTNFVENAGSNLSDAITNVDPTSLLTNPAVLGIAEKALGISGNDAKNINTAVKLIGAFATGGPIGVGLSLLGGSGITSALTGLLGGSGALSSLTSLGSIPGLGSVIGAFMGGGGLAGPTKQAAGFSNTVNRSTLDAAVVKILGNSKIPTPIYTVSTAKSQAASTNITQANNVLAGLQGQATSAISSAVNTASADIGSAVSSFFG